MTNDRSDELDEYKKDMHAQELDWLAEKIFVSLVPVDTDAYTGDARLAYSAAEAFLSEKARRAGDAK
jgi:hypothetical protein